MEPPWSRSTSKHGLPKGSLSQNELKRETSIEHGDLRKGRTPLAAIPSRPQKLDGRLMEPGVRGWLDGLPDESVLANPDMATPRPRSEPCPVPAGGCHLDQEENYETVNKFISGQRYFVDDGKGGAPTSADRALMRETMPWNDPPRVLNICTPKGRDSRTAPESSQAAIAKFESMAMENQSVVSEVATCGTHLLGLQPAGEISSVTGGHLLRKVAFKQPATPATRLPLSAKDDPLKFELELAPELLKHASSVPLESKTHSIRDNAPSSKFAKAVDGMARDDLIMDETDETYHSNPRSFWSLNGLDRRDILEVPHANGILKASNVSEDSSAVENEKNNTCAVPRENMRSEPSQVATNIINNSEGRQIGIAKIRIEMLSLIWAGESSDSLDSEDEENDVDDDRLDNKENEDPNTNSYHGRESGGDQWRRDNGSGTGDFTAPTGGQRGSSSRSHKELNNNNKRGGNGGNNPNKRRRMNPPDVAKTLPRFACPYQAYETFRDCLQRGRRNPQGGCDGIYRLRQHLRRRHMLSWRCRTCWKSLDTKAQQSLHVEKASCQQKPKPEGDRFMETNHEAEVEALCGDRTLPEEDAWWQLFRCLIPGMALMDDESWATERLKYYPYYIPGGISLTIPSLNFTDISFLQAQPGPGDPRPGTSSLLTSQSYPQGSGPSYISTMAPMTQSSTFMSQTLSVPVFESVPDTRSHDCAVETGGQSYDPHAVSENDFISSLGLSPGQENTTTTPIMSSQSQSQSQGQSQSQTSISQSSSHTSLSSPPGASMLQALSTLDPLIHNTHHKPPANNNTAHNNTSTYSDTTATAILRQNNERLRARNQRTEAENTELRDANRAARAEVSRAEEIIEELLMRAADPPGPGPGPGDDVNSSRTLNHGLLELARLLETASEKLRKAS